MCLVAENIEISFASGGSIGPPLVGRRIGPLDFEIEAGSCAALVGPSGVGKTTLLRLLAGFVQPVPGCRAKICLNGRPLVDEHRKIIVPPWERRLGLVYQKARGLQPHRSVRENLEFPLLYGTGVRLSATEIERRIREAVESFGLHRGDGDGEEGTPDSLLEQRVETLSGGQQQRVAIARCFIRPDRELYLLDEAFEGLDSPLRQRLARELRERIERLERAPGRAQCMVMVTHYQPEALSLADRVLFLIADGDNPVSIRYDGDPRTLYQRPPQLALARFLGDPFMNELSLDVEGSAVLVEGYKVGGLRAEDLPLAPLIACVRAEDVRPHPIETKADADGVWLVSELKRTSFEGEEVIMTLLTTSTNRELRVQVDRDPGLARGALLQLEIPRKAIHFFDRKNGQRWDLGHG